MKNYNLQKAVGIKKKKKNEKRKKQHSTNKTLKKVANYNSRMKTVGPLLIA